MKMSKTRKNLLRRLRYRGWCTTTLSAQHVILQKEIERHGIAASRLWVHISTKPGVLSKNEITTDIQLSIIPINQKHKYPLPVYVLHIDELELINLLAKELNREVSSTEKGGAK